MLNRDIHHPKWLEPPPEVRSRVVLQQARRRGGIPDGSYDFDGDGVVGSLDYFVGRAFDSDNDGRLTRSERGRAEKALEYGFLDKYVRGLEATGVHRGPYLIRQRGGVICGPDNPGEAGASMYPPHFNAHKVPQNETRTALKISRTAELKGAAAAVGEKLAAKCAPIPEPQPHTAVTEPRTCPISHIWERAEADHQLARVRAGLLPMNTATNPERELKTVGLDFVEKPYFATRGQLLETRRELMKKECEDLRAKGDEECVPMSVRKAQKEVAEFEFRRGQAHDPMTLTKLKDERRRAKIEYDMSNFTNPDILPRAYPKFSDRPDVPFWVSEQSEASAPRASQAMLRAVSEPVLKVTDVPFGFERNGEQQQNWQRTVDPNIPAGKPIEGMEGRLGTKTVKRWTTDLLERGQGRNKPRLFDSIQPALPGPKELEHLDLTSSMDPVRYGALRRRAQERQHALSHPKKSRLYNEASQATMLTGVHFQKPVQISSAEAAPEAVIAPVMDATVAPKSYNKRMTSEPVLKGHAGSREPRFFGSTRPMSQAAVRSGGFQRFESSHTSPMKPRTD